MCNKLFKLERQKKGISFECLELGNCFFTEIVYCTLRLHNGQKRRGEKEPEAPPKEPAHRGSRRKCACVYYLQHSQGGATADIIYCFFYTFLPITWQPKQSHRAHNCLLATRHYDAVKTPFLLPTSPRPKKTQSKCY